MTPRSQSEIPEYKKKAVAELSKLVDEKKTIIIASIKNIPASQFQEIVKKLRGKAIVKVPKRSLIVRALDNTKNKEIKKIEENIGDSTAVLFSDMECFDLAADLIYSKRPAKAKPGQEAPEDIEVEAGPTDLVPGPAISELGAVGIQIQIEKGKIHIKEPKIIVKKGNKISQGAADIMGKLDIQPFEIGFIPIVAFDKEKNILYTEIKIDRKEAVESLKSSYGKALAFAVQIGCVNEDTIKVMINKAVSHERRLIKIITGEPDEPIIEAPKEEEKKEEIKQEEEKAPAAEGLSALFG